tara:strand:- start:700 stop:900 length:201 start_codon:yes stop_codon:yes gene_type:complete
MMAIVEAVTILHGNAQGFLIFLFSLISAIKAVDSAVFPDVCKQMGVFRIFHCHLLIKFNFFTVVEI